jgi:23S rRNA (pseudouridine1915-N3)-methyltransferase
MCLTEEGKQVTSREFSDFIYKQNRDIGFLIGGPDGHSKAIRQKADKLLSFSKMTLPHEMALLVLSEQLFRAVSIKNGSKYHRD